jgi:GNAT superfamily N-acetyltransferase
MKIRPARPEDIPQILAMLRESAADQDEPDAVIVSEAELREDLFGATPCVHVLVAESGGACAGLALYFFNYSTWISRLGLYLEDLYVRPEHRGSGLARRIMIELARIAIGAGCGRLHWTVLRSNDRAIRFYKKIGAHLYEDWAPMYLTGDALRRLANSTPEDR